MNIQEHIPRNALVWIVICLFAVVAPHATRLPLWVVGVYLLAVTWRIMVYRGRWSFPGRAVKFAITASCFAGIALTYQTLITLEATVALLLLAFALKLVELVRRKDAYVLLFLGYFVCLTEFLFSQDILVTLFSLVNVVLITTALIALHQPGQQRFSKEPLRLAGVMVAQALPLMLVMFFLFPRFGPLWTVPIKSGAAKTGMSDFMKPGDVARLSQSDDVAFRVKFEGEIPPQAELYWRGLVLSRLKEGTWSAIGYYQVPDEERRPVAVDTQGVEPLNYTVIMEPSHQNWLYGLHYAQSSSGSVVHAPDYRLFSMVPVEAELMYSASSWTQAPVEVELSSWRRKAETRLPADDDPRTRQLARTMHGEAASDRAFVDSVLAMFNEQPFVYTLNPGFLAATNAMDDFVFVSRRGFCEHYAYAFVLMMRAAGLPSRVVAGYQGGEINPVNKTVIVHQFDAHAWAEVWLEGEGWVRVDPTAAVSPLRIEAGLEQAMQGDGSFLSESPLSPARYRSIPLVNQFRLRYDALTYRWQSWVVGFDNKRQIELLHDFFGEISARMFILALFGTALLVLLPVAWSLLRGRSMQVSREHDKYYRAFCARLEALGLQRQSGETPGQYALRVKQALPASSATIDNITRLYNELAYADSALSSADRQDGLRRLRQAARQFRPNRRAIANH
ncbi:MAG: DUF3488 and DUF4129 domain-containing transglutaminase family protein [Gammaproteobacteria bacterium]|nr:DUF3488 and DUF4129 domain-containing transglutaminase family protein [Gammaproteobacteria bacterium]